MQVASYGCVDQSTTLVPILVVHSTTSLHQETAGIEATFPSGTDEGSPALAVAPVHVRPELKQQGYHLSKTLSGKHTKERIAGLTQDRVRGGS